MQNDDREMEALSKAIVEAILGSNDVQRALKKVESIELSSNNSIMVFVVKLDSLSEVKEKLEKGTLREIKPPAKKKACKKTEKKEVIDGKILSLNEEKFLNYLSQNFDQEIWLKRLKLTL